MVSLRNTFGSHTFSMLDGERDIILEAIEGEASAFGRLYDAYQPQIYRFVLLRVSRREEAEDLTHQVFLHALQRIASYQNLGFPFSSWLYRIARNLLIDYYRKTRKTVSIEEIEVYDEKFAIGIESRLDMQAKTKQVMHALTKLKPDYQSVIIMRFIEELSLKETAVALEKTEGAIKLLQHRAMKALRTQLE